MLHPTRLFLIRHGEVEDQYHRIFGGSRIDMDLSPRGHEQASALAGYLQSKSFDAIYVSPMLRAQKTLAPLAGLCAQPALTVPEFREVDFGDWTGHSWEQVKAKFNVSAFQWLDQMEAGTLPNGESAAQFRSRIEPPLRSLVERHAGQTAAIVCHGGVVRMMLSILLDLPLRTMASFEIDYASLTVVERHQHKTEVMLLNFTPWRDLV